MRLQSNPETMKTRKIRANLAKLELDMRKIAEEFRSLSAPYGENFRNKAEELVGAAEMIKDWNQNILKEMK